mgnify:FL=1
MSKAQSIWSKADKFLTLTRKIFLNSATILVLILITFSMIAGIGTIFSSEEKVDTENKVLWFKPVGVVVDANTTSSPSIEDILGNISTQQHELDDLLKVLEKAATDDSLSAVYVNVSELGMFYASAFEIASAVKNIRENGKQVIAYSEIFENNSYLISSQANKVFLNNYGGVGALGLSRKREYVKDLYENIKLNYHVFIAGNFKTGPEPYTRNSMSEEDKLSWREFADPLWQKMTDMMESGRGIPKGTMQKYGDSLWELSIESPEISEIALDLNLVDGIVTREELRHWMFQEFPNKKNDKNNYPDSISIYEYLSTIEDKKNTSKNKIAVVNVEGAITTGEAAYNIAGADTIVENIQKAIKDKSVKALVLRVNSPGGDVWSSELITNSLNEFKETGRPIVSSMGDIAASGGVWVTTLSDEIWAKPETLTGSIGVYGIITTIDGIYDWAGVNVDGISSTKGAEWDPRFPMPNYVSKSIQASVDHTYDKFVSKVAENRDMPYKEVLAIAAGRIWSGEKAQQLGLVDEIGDLNDAIESAAKLADINEYRIITYKKELDPIDIFISEILDNFDIKINIGKRTKQLLSLFDSQYQFIDNEKNINIAAYCFECDFIQPE